ncbi:hypothetical protein Trydic_g8416 [Trypoxylus dichotomus]
MKKNISSSSTPSQEESRDHALHAEKLHTSTGIVQDIENNKILLKITYLGYEVNVEGIRPSKDHTDATRNYPIPKNAEQVQRFLGLTSYFRKFVELFLILAAPLYKLIKKSTDWKFGDEEMHAFEILKSKLAEKPVLAIYSPEAETELHCDASTRGYGSILLQRQADDCDSLPRIVRWVVYLHNFDYVVEHRPGNRMAHVDALSRAHVLILEENTFEQILGLKQTTDPKIKEIKEQLLIKEMPFYKLRNGMVFRKDKKKLTFYVPEEMEQNVIRTVHEDIAHLGVEKVTEYIRETYWFPNMKEKAKAYIDNCLKCIVYNPKYGPREGLLHNIDKDNSSHNSSTKETPSKLLFCVPQTGRVSDELRQILLDSYGNERNLEARNEAEENIKKQQEYSKAYYDGVNKKLIPKFKGPYVVKKVLPNDLYAIGDPPDFQNTQIPFDGVLDSNNIKAWSKRI